MAGPIRGTTPVRLRVSQKIATFGRFSLSLSRRERRRRHRRTRRRDRRRDDGDDNARSERRLSDRCASAQYLMIRKRDNISRGAHLGARGLSRWLRASRLAADLVHPAARCFFVVRFMGIYGHCEGSLYGAARTALARNVRRSGVIDRNRPAYELFIDNLIEVKLASV